jgi:hypothetical protein
MNSKLTWVIDRAIEAGNHAFTDLSREASDILERNILWDLYSAWNKKFYDFVLKSPNVLILNKRLVELGLTPGPVAQQDIGKYILLHRELLSAQDK